MHRLHERDATVIREKRKKTEEVAELVLGGVLFLILSNLPTQEKIICHCPFRHNSRAVTGTSPCTHSGVAC